jgi:transposase
LVVVQAITLEDTKRAVQLYENGLTITQVVERVGYSYGTIRRVLHEQGVAMRAVTVGNRTASEERQ